MVGSPDDFLETKAITTGFQSDKTNPCNRLQAPVPGDTRRGGMRNDSIHAIGRRAFTIIDLLVLVLMVSILIILLAMLL
jgi:hypothetical protein